MPPSIHPSKHTQECNALVAILQKCREENKYMKFFGICTDEEYAVSRCFAKERQDQLTEQSNKIKRWKAEQKKMKNTEESKE